jgi:predicted dinucleotide-binding enzyme
MKIGIIGIGAIGGAIARKLASSGHQISVANSRGVEAVAKFALEIGAKGTDAQGAVEGADAVVISIPFPAIQRLPKGLVAGLAQHVPVIDTGNYAPNIRDPHLSEVDQGKTEAVWVSEQLGRPTVKTFNNIMARSLAERGKPKGTVGRIALPIFGDDARQKTTAMRLVEEMGFDAIDAGNLQESWRAQPGTPVYCCDYEAEELKKGLAAAISGKAVERRDYVAANRAELMGKISSYDDLINLQRRIYAV